MRMKEKVDCTLKIKTGLFTELISYYHKHLPRGRLPGHHSGQVRSLETGKSSEVINTNESSRLGYANGKNPQQRNSNNQGPVLFLPSTLLRDERRVSRKIECRFFQSVNDSLGLYPIYLEFKPSFQSDISQSLQGLLFCLLTILRN